jgi:hypothetical protein
MNMEHVKEVLLLQLMPKGTKADNSPPQLLSILYLR